MEQFEALQTQAAAAVQSSKKESVHKSAEEIEEESKCLLERLEEVKGVKEDVLRWDSAIEEERRQVLYSHHLHGTASRSNSLNGYPTLVFQLQDTVCLFGTSLVFDLIHSPKSET